MDKKQQLNAVIAHNRAIDEQALELNRRAKEEVFPVVSIEDRRAQILSQLDGARSVSEIKDFDALKLPELDPKKVARVLTDNPDTIMVEGHELSVTYSRYSEKPSVAVEERVARALSSDTIVLPGGREVAITCGRETAPSVSELVEKLEKQRIERAWSEVASHEEHTSWISNPENVFPYLDRLAKPEIEITRTNNGAGDPVYGYLSLYSDSDPDFQIRFRKSREEAEKETRTGMHRLLTKACGDAVKILRESPWYTSGWSVSLTALGKALQTRLDALFDECVEDLTVENVRGKIAMLADACKRTKEEFAVEHDSMLNAITDLQARLNALIGDFDEYALVEETIDVINAQLKSARELLDTGDFSATKHMCDELNTSLDQLKGTYETLVAEKKEAKKCFGMVSEALKDLADDNAEFSGTTDENLRDRAHELLEDIANLFERYAYAEVIKRITEAEALLAEARAAKDGVATTKQLDALKALWGHQH